MQMINIPLYQFCELAEEAQKKALDDHHYINVDYFSWYQFAIDDFCSLCETIGITIGTSDISFRGFYSQGDGSSFVAQVNLSSFIKGVQLKAWQSYAPELELNISLPAVDNRVLELIENEMIYSNVTTKRPNQRNGLRVNVDFDYSIGKCKNYIRINSSLDQLEIWITSSLEAINCHLYECLKSEYEWLTSDMSVQETIESNETLFTADGMSADHLKAFAQDKLERLIP